MYLGALATLAVLSAILDFAKSRPWWHLLASLLAVAGLASLVVSYWSESTAAAMGRWALAVLLLSTGWLMLSFAQRIGELIPKIHSAERRPAASAEYVWFLAEGIFLAPAIVIGVLEVIRAWT